MAFGSFDTICSKAAFPICSVLGSTKEYEYFSKGLLPKCYARSVELANTMIFRIGNAFVCIGLLAILLIIVFNVRSKYTAIGRKEMLYLQYLLIALTVSTLIVDCGVSPPSSASYAYFVSIQIGFASAVCACIFYNGLVCFQFWEDGTRKSIWTARIITALWFLVNFIVSMITFKGWKTSLDNEKPMAIFVISYVLNAIILAAYVVSQIILVIFALDSYWPLGAIVLGVFFFVVGQILAYVFNDAICQGASHYVDALFFSSICNCFTIMMHYKYWDMITTDDLEFSVANVEQGVNAFSMGEDEKRSSAFFS